MAWAEKRRKRAPMYDACWREGEARMRQPGFDTKREAERYGEDREAAYAARGGVTSRDAGKVLFGAYAEAWMARRPDGEYTLETMRPKMAHAIRRFGEQPIASITRAEVRDWLTDLFQRPQPGRSQPYAPSTVRQAYHYFHAVMIEAVEEDHLRETDPCANMRLKMLPAKRAKRLRKVPEQAMVEAMVEAMPVHYRAVVLLAAEIGMRQGEILGLTRDRVDTKLRTITVDRQMQTRKGSGAALKVGAKWGSDRVIPVVEGCNALALIAEHMLAHPSRRPDGLIFTTDEGTPVRRGTFSCAWRRAQRRTGATFRFHDLRAYAVSRMAKDGVRKEVIAEVMGHTVEVMERAYLGLFTDDLRDELAEGYRRRLARG